MIVLNAGPSTVLWFWRFSYVNVEYFAMRGIFPPVVLHYALARGWRLDPTLYVVPLPRVCMVPWSQQHSRYDRFFTAKFSPYDGQRVRDPLRGLNPPTRSPIPSAFQKRLPSALVGRYDAPPQRSHFRGFYHRQGRAFELEADAVRRRERVDQAE